MDLQLTSDQHALMAAVDRLCQPYELKPSEFQGFALVGEGLEKELEAGDYFEIASVPEMGPLAAAMVVERLARLPYTVEAAASMLVRPQLPGKWPRPLAVIESARPGRFVAQARTILLIEGESTSVVRTERGDAEPVESLFAYPMGRLNGSPKAVQLAPAESANVRKWLRIALAAESSGLMQAAIATAVEHLTLRRQFGRPLGAFQALHHRMAECAVLAGGVRWLMLKAAGTGDAGDAALAALHAQESATRLVYDVHQMLAAMGITLEHSLHLWTYRLKSLQSDLGGRGGQGRAVARYCFNAPREGRDGAV